jgi:two-component system sensor histidine kinase RegB
VGSDRRADPELPSADRPSDPSVRPPGAPRLITVHEGDAGDDPADRWLVWLRFGAVGGMAATILAADRFVDGLDTTGMMSVLLAIGASNLGWLTLTSRTAQRRRKQEQPGRRYVEAQLALDVVSLAVMLWFAGGVTNPFAVFLTFQIALAGLLCTPRATLGITALTVGAASVLILAPPLPALPPTLARLATVVSLSSLAAILGAFVAVYAQRLSQLRAESARNEKLAVLGRLVGSMSHELNTPLATILLLSRDLEQFRAGMGEEELRELAHGIVAEAERANEIVGLVRGHVGPDQAPEPVELCGFVEELARAELARLRFSGDVRFDLEGPVTALVMKRALVQVLANLLRNAAEASLIGRRRITISVRDAGGRAEIAVEDRGPGFSPEILARLGEPFQTTKQAEGGMGLGLYVSAMLARQMGAALSVASSRGGGARVVLSLDRAPESAGEAPESAVG